MGTAVRTYLFDASAVVDIYHPRNLRIRRILDYIVEQRTRLHCAILYVPAFCIVEVFNTLARMRFRQGKLSDEEYRECLDGFRRDIHWASVLYPYALNRYHMLGADTIIPVEQNTPSKTDWDRLSTYDILLIAMACELAYLGDPSETFLVTCDARVKGICDTFKTTELAVRERWMVRRSHDEPALSRWIPPDTLYLPRARPDEIPPVVGQHPLGY